MAKKKKVKGRKKGQKKPDKIGEKDYLQMKLDDIQELDDLGVNIRRKPGPENDVLKALAPFLSKTEYKIYADSGAFGEVELEPTETLAENASEIINCSVMTGSPAAPVAVYGDNGREQSSADALGRELKHLTSLLHPAEMKWFLAEMAADLVEGVNVTHTDISDAIIASLAPSTAQKLALQSDAQYKYTTSQFLQVYNKLRHTVLEHKLMQGSAHADALTLAVIGLEVGPLTPQDKAVPLSAVDALRHWDGKLAGWDQLDLITCEPSIMKNGST